MRRVLIIAGGLQIGGAEKVAANISKYAPGNEFEFHYLIFKGYDNIYGKEIIERGGKVFEIPSFLHNYLAYIKTVGNLIERYKYCAVHSHTMFNSGINLAIAKWHNVPVRIAHSHTTKTDTEVSVLQRMYERIMQKSILLNATDLFACGKDAGIWLYGEKAFKSRCKVILNGIDIYDNIYDSQNRRELRNKLQIEEKYVIGHVGSLLHVKNQKFLIDIFPEILKNKPNALLLFLGEGPDLNDLREHACKMHLEDKIIFYGKTLEVNRFLSVMDVFAFPSFREGTPLAVLEAQTNGLPCVISKQVPKDVLLTDLVTYLPLNDKQGWVKALCCAERREPEKYAAIMAESGYSAACAYKPVYEAYERGYR